MVAQSVSDIALEIKGVQDVVLLEGFNVLNSTNQTNAATAFVTLKEWTKRTSPELRALALSHQLQDKILEKVRGGVALVLQPPPIRGLSQTGGFEFMIEDRDGRGVDALAKVTDQFLAEARRVDGTKPAYPELAAVFTPFSAQVPQLRFVLDRIKAERLDVVCRRRVHRPPDQPGRLLRQRLQSLRQGLESDDSGARARRRSPRTTSRRFTCSTARRTGFP